MKHIKLFENFTNQEIDLNKVLIYLQQHNKSWDSGECGNLALTISKILNNVTFYHSADKDHIMWSIDNGLTLYDGLGKPIHDDKSGDILQVYPIESRIKPFIDFKPDKKINDSGPTGILSKIDKSLYDDLFKLLNK